MDKKIIKTWPYKVRHNASSRFNFGPHSQTHFSKSEFKTGRISRFCFVFQVIQVISSGKVDLNFISWICIHESDFKGFFLEKRPWKRISIKCSNSGINESTPQTQSNVIWISGKEELEISFLNSLLQKWVWESGPKIDPATGVRIDAGRSTKFVLVKSLDSSEFSSEFSDLKTL